MITELRKTWTWQVGILYLCLIFVSVQQIITELDPVVRYEMMTLCTVSIGHYEAALVGH